MIDPVFHALHALADVSDLLSQFSVAVGERSELEQEAEHQEPAIEFLPIVHWLLIITSSVPVFAAPHVESVVFKDVELRPTCRGVGKVRK